MELSSLLSSGAGQFVQSSREKTAQADNQEFLNNLQHRRLIFYTRLENYKKCWNFFREKSAS